MVADFQRQPHRPVYFHDERSCYDSGAALFVSYLVQRHGIALIRDVFRSGKRDPLEALSALLPARGGERARDPARVRPLARPRRALPPPGRLPRRHRFPEVSADRWVSPYEFIDAPLTSARATRRRPWHDPTWEWT